MHTVKVAMILIPSFHGLHQEHMAYKLGPTDKKKQTTAFLESPSAKASSTNQRTFGSVDGDFIKSDRTKNTRKMLRHLSGLIYYSNTIFGNICGKNEVISHYCVLKSHGAQDEFRTFASAHARYLVIFTETCK